MNKGFRFLGLVYKLMGQCSKNVITIPFIGREDHNQTTREKAQGNKEPKPPLPRTAFISTFIGEQYATREERDPIKLPVS